MLIAEFACRAGVSARMLRHYENMGLLVPERTARGYRIYSAEDLVTIERIRLMLNAGLSAVAAKQYLDCVRAGESGLTVHMCPNLKYALGQVEARLKKQEARIMAERGALERLTAVADSYE